MDKITPLAAPPGHSLTGVPGKWPWERPPEFSNPDDVIDNIIEKFENGGGKDDLAKMMLAGVTVEELVNQISFKGFMNGKFSPDVAELIKPAMAIYLMGLADDAGFEPQLFVNDPEQSADQISDEAFFNIMKQRNPQLHADMIEEMNRSKRMPSDSPRTPQQQQPEPSFMQMTGEM